jgi:hypothetical protein
VLKEAGLVLDHRLGNRRSYEVVPEGLADLAAYLGTFWSGALERFRAEAVGPRCWNSSPRFADTGDR